mmetsp:Transcript_42315/g.62788  ORF Transcript_42315/g.62788 Transcript_42315/m.62788 type:complete len:1003 (-) Transcript_42315:64-3072(-)|eukprot:CAMPEP_0194047142 /NCGR_PEP_ID=MMETSP0009_2-20130614/23579_1 /TAXON_ID=210454 /ORGANISM="Grammatophora oceanica, Strain CCMP 410" /LENGTH=1002 /DNA_ID=CAMNT_0038692669 /DNA_START=510 /DNA_END=3518 /DNA_ORIENTATION=-
MSSSSSTTKFTMIQRIGPLLLLLLLRFGGSHGLSGSLDTRGSVEKKESSAAGGDANQEAAGGAQARIIGGDEAVEGRYPYAVSLVKFGFHFCGGSVVAPDMILSAAHCKGEATSVQVGRHDRNDRFDTYEVLPVVQEFPHPQYDARQNYDQMLIKVSKTTNAQSVRLNSDGDVPQAGQETTVMGWGATVSGDSSSTSPELLEVTVGVVSNEQCRQAKNPAYPFTNYYNDIFPNMMCAIDEGEDSCQGDSGGPLIIRGGSASGDVQIGVVSWGYGCAIPGFPGVYSRTSADFDWIRDTICERSEAPPSYLNCGGSAPVAGPVVTPAPTPVPTAEPTLSDGVPLKILIQMDQYPEEIGFVVEHLTGFSTTEVFRRPAGAYINQKGELIEETVMLQESEQYSFTIFDIFNDGIGDDGFYKLFIGDTEVVSALGDFQNGREHLFIASETDPATPPPDDPEPGDLYLTLELTFDSYPQETGWILRRVAYNGSPLTELISYVPPRSYSNDLANQKETLIIPIPADGGDFTFDLTDSYGDGLCCEHGNGSYKIYLGDVSDGTLLGEGQAIDAARERVTFTVSVDGVVNPGSSPSPGPPPTLSPAPTTPLTPLFIEILPDEYPQDIGWTIEDEDGNLIERVLTGSYAQPDLIDETIDLQSCKNYKFTIVDEYEDGICCQQGEGYYKLTNNNGLIASGGKFTLGESIWFATECTYPIEIAVFTDQFPQETSWSVRRLDVLTDNAQVARIDSDTYEEEGVREEHELEVVEGGLYQLVIGDKSSEQDGICCQWGEGYFEIDNGVGESKRYSGEFGRVTKVLFLAGEPASPSSGRTLNLKITFDEFPDELSWFLVADLESSSGSVAASRTFYKQQRVVAFGPETPYSSNNKGLTIVEKIFLDPVLADEVRRYTLVLIDFAKDGLCCQFGSGAFALHDGSEDDDDNIILDGSFEASAKEVRSFELTADGGQEVSAPTLPPTIGASTGESAATSFFSSTTTATLVLLLLGSMYIVL